MKTPKERAENIVKRYSNKEIAQLGYQSAYEYSIKCAKIAVDEILGTIGNMPGDNRADYDYYVEVKQELEKM